MIEALRGKCRVELPSRMAIFRLSVLGVVLCCALICAGTEELKKSKDEFPSNSFQDNLDILLKLDGVFRADDPTPTETCKPEEVAACREENKTCLFKDPDSHECGGCLLGFKKDGELCTVEPCQTGSEEACNTENKICLFKDPDSHECGGCLPGFKKDGEECKAEPCQSESEIACKTQNKICLFKDPNSHECGGCLLGFKKNGDQCKAEPCKDDGNKACKTANKICLFKDPDGHECGGCLLGFKKNGEECKAANCKSDHETICRNNHTICMYQDPDSFKCGGCVLGFKKNGAACEKAECKPGDAEVCKGENRSCLYKDSDSFQCGNCTQGYKEEGGKCVEENCNNFGQKVCDQSYKNCLDQEGGGYECKGCKKTYKPKEGTEECEAETCENTGKEVCDDSFKKCENKQRSGYECKGCKDKFVQKEGTDECVPETCDNAGKKMCDNSYKKCVDKTEGGYECGECKENYIPKEGTDKCVAVTCENTGKKICDAANKKCANKQGSGYECKGCKDKFVQKEGTDECEPETCSNVGDKICGSTNRTCENKEGGGYECKGCKDSFVLKEGTNKCFAESCDNNDDCKHNGTCSKQLCTCLSGFGGDNCEAIDQCETGTYKECKDGKGECKFVEATVVCECDGEKKLDNDLNYCRNQCEKHENCLNGGECNDKKFCKCKKGYIGDTCEIIKDCVEKKKECEKVDAECRLDESTSVAYCHCKDENYIYKNGNCKTAKWCDADSCKGGECIFENGIGRCKCQGDQYFDYKEGGCKKIDPCLLLSEPCPENKRCDSNDGKCKCIRGFKPDGETCKPNACASSPCFTGAECVESYKPNVVKCACKNGQFYKGKCLDASCFLPDQNCTKCPSGMKSNNGVCEHEEGKKCEKDCGFGWCIKNGEDEKCVCKNNQYTESKAGKCVLKASACASGKIDTEDPSKCNCKTDNNMYKMSSNGITCDRKSCADEDVKNICKNLNARCVDQWKNSTKAFDCVCDEGYLPYPNTGVCTDACTKAQNTSECSINKQTCFLTNELKAVDCKCSPAFTYSDERKRCEPSALEQDVMLHNLPVKRDRYLKDGSVDIVKLHKDVIDAMEKVFTKQEVAFARLYKYKSSNDILLCDVWLQVQKSVAQTITNRWTQQPFKKDTLLLLPPALVLSSEKLGEVKVEKMVFCSDDVKAAHCGRNAGCKGKECSCEKGFKPIESTRTKYGDYTTLYCEDIDECVEESNECTANTTCSNTVGGYYCKCNPGYKKSTGSANEENRDPCIGLCSPNPCHKGKCDIKNYTIDCTCDPGYGGSFCNRGDPNFKKAAQNAVIVGAVLGTLLGVVVLLFVFYVVRQRKNSYSEDFTPAPRIDNAEMADRRPMRGVSNRAYQ